MTDVATHAPGDEIATLRARVAHLEGLIADLRVGVVVQGPDAEILVANAAALDLLGVTRDEMVGRTSLDGAWDVTHEDGRPFPGETHPVPEAIRTRRPVRDVVMGVYRKARNDRVWLVVNADPILDDDGEVARVLCTFTDITERRRAEAKLRESESLNRRILESMPGGVVFVAADGAIVGANGEAARTLGMPVRDLLATNAKAFAPRAVWENGTACPADAWPATKCIATGRRQTPTTIGLRRADGTISWAVYSAIPLFEPESHEVSGAVVTFVDITERKQLEEHLRHVHRVEAVARLAGGVAHHFNNLLTVINGYAALMMKRLASDDPIADDAREIRKAADRASQLTRQLLAFNRRHDVDRRLVDVNAVLGEMRSMLAPLFGELVRLDVALAAEPSTVWADPAQLEDVVLNLAVNARDAMPDGGVFALSTRNEDVDVADARRSEIAPGRYVVLEAVDTGTGIAPDVLAHVFEPFFTTKEVGQGTGLGLSTVHEIATQSGGYVEVRSEPGRGASFAVYLPHVDRTARVDSVAGPLDVRRGRETVLVVEDDEAVRGYLCETLGRSGYRVLEAADGRTALAASERYPGSISLLVADVVMPEMGGPALARAMLAARPRLRVLFISGYLRESAAEVDSVAADSLEKPFTAEAFAAKVRGILDAAP
jgi:two-component system cell cycle sensor histidine kinase/response regulator CckA